MTRIRTAHRIAAAGAAAALALGAAACGDDEEGQSGNGQAGTTDVRTTEPAKSDAQGQFVSFTGGATRLMLDGNLTTALDAAQVDVAPVGGADADGGAIVFPITGGRVANGTFEGRVLHRGGIRFTAGDRSVTAQNLVVDTKAGTVTSDVDGQRLPLFSLDTAAMEHGADGATATASGIELTLPRQGADALNEALGTNALRSGLSVGELSVRADVNEG